MKRADGGGVRLSDSSGRCFFFGEILTECVVHGLRIQNSSARYVVLHALTSSCAFERGFVRDPPRYAVPSNACRIRFTISVMRTLILAIGLCSLASGCSMPPSAATMSSPSVEAAQSRSLSGHEITQILGYHNKVRSDVNVGPLRWSDHLANFAGNWADTLAKKGCTLEHRQKSRYGENLFLGTASHYSVVDAAKAWESEKRLYGGGKLTESNWYDSGHYTQMVWRNTEDMGCAKSLCDGNMIVVCNYDPPGNYLGEKPY